MRKFLVLFAVLVVVGCTTKLPQSPVSTGYLQSCPSGLRVIAHVWSLQAQSLAVQNEVKRLMKLAESRDTRVGTDPAGYRGDAVSRTLGAQLRKAGVGRARVNFDLAMVYRDSSGRVAGPIGSMRVERGIAMITLAGDPRANGWVLETIWPADFISPVKSGDERRLWLFPEEWKSHCEMNIHGFVA